MPEFDGREPSRSKAIRREAACLGAFGVLAVVATYPLARRMGTAIPGGGDAWQFYWNLWWVKRALVDLHVTPYFTPDLYFPYGASLYFHTLNLLPSILAVPVVQAAGLPAAYNSIILFTFIASGYGMYRLVLYVLRRQIVPDGSANLAARLAAFVAGVTFSFSSYHFAHIGGHLDLMSTQWLPFSVLFLLKTSHEEGWRSPIVCAVLLAATALTSFYYLLFVLLFTVFLLAHLLTTRGQEWAHAARRVAGAYAIFALLVSPIFVPILAAGRTEGRTPNPAYDVERFSTDALAFFVPPFSHPGWGPAVAPLYDRMVRPDSRSEAVAFLGYVPMLLAIVGLKSFRAIRAFWLTALLLFAMLALGPVLHVAGHRVAGPVSLLLPYRLLALLPYGDIPRVPARFVVMSMLCLSVLAGCGAWLVLRRRARPAAFGAALLLVMLSVGETTVAPVSMAAVLPPAFYDRLAGEPVRAGVLEVPIPDDPAAYPRRMMYQTRHGKPVYGGYVSRSLPPLPFDAVPGFSQFKTLSDNIDDIVSYDSRQLPVLGLAILNATGAGHIVVDKELLDANGVERVRRIADSVLGPAARVYEDAATLAFTVPPPATSSTTAIWLDAGWSYLERLQEQGAGGGPVKWRWMGDRARLGIVAAEPTTASLRLEGYAFGRTRRLKVSVGGAEAVTLRVPTDKTALETPRFPVGAGISFVDLESLDGAGSPGTQDLRRLSVAMTRIEVVTVK